MKVLMISQMAPYLPCNDGFRIIPANVIKYLAARHEYHLVTFNEVEEQPAQLAWARDYCASVTHLQVPPAATLAERLRRLMNPYSLPAEAVAHIQRLQPDLLHLEGPYMASLGVHAPAGCATVLSAHDCMALRYQHFARYAPTLRQRLRFRILGNLGARYERRWYPRMDQVVITSPMDAEKLAAMIPGVQPVVIPNGVELPLPSSLPRGAQRMIFTGNMSWFPNEDAAAFFVQQVLPQVRRQFPNAEFWIVGSTPSARVQALAAQPGVVVTGMVPTLSEYIGAADVYVSPLRFGAGVKNKILEAMAANVPIVATPISLSGTPLKSGHHLLIAEGPADLAAAVARIFREPQFAAALAQAAMAELQLRYTWEHVANQFDEVYAAARRTLDSATLA